MEHYQRLTHYKVSREDKRKLASLPKLGTVALPARSVPRLVRPVKVVSWERFAADHGITLRPSVNR